MHTAIFLCGGGPPQNDGRGSCHACRLFCPRAPYPPLGGARGARWCRRGIVGCHPRSRDSYRRHGGRGACSRAASSLDAWTRIRGRARSPPPVQLRRTSPTAGLAGYANVVDFDVSAETLADATGTAATPHLVGAAAARRDGAAPDRLPRVARLPAPPRRERVREARGAAVLPPLQGEAASWVAFDARVWAESISQTRVYNLLHP